MNYKYFFKPTTWRVVLFIIFILLTFFIPKTAKICGMAPGGVVCGRSEAYGLGYPMFFGTRFSGDVLGVGLYPLNLLINIVIFYSASCGIVVLCSKVRKK